MCAILLGDDPDTLVRDLQEQFPKADLVGADRRFEQTIAQVVGFIEAPALGLDLPLDLRGTAFQQRVWQALRDIPLGTTASYAQIAERLSLSRSTTYRLAALLAERGHLDAGGHGYKLGPRMFALGASAALAQSAPEPARTVHPWQAAPPRLSPSPWASTRSPGRWPASGRRSTASIPRRAPAARAARWP